MNTSRDQDFTR